MPLWRHFGDLNVTPEYWPISGKSKQAFTCYSLTIETLEQRVNYVQN